MDFCAILTIFKTLPLHKEGDEGEAQDTLKERNNERQRHRGYWGYWGNGLIIRAGPK